MTITVFGATGMIGKFVIQKALAQKHTVIAFGRNVESLIDTDLQNEHLIAMKGYVFDEKSVYKALKNTDAVISVLGGSFDGTDKARSVGVKNILAQMDKANIKRIIILGGKGILQADGKELIMDKPGYPEMYLPVGREHLQAYEYCKKSNTDWTVVAPPNLLDVDATGNYTTSAEYAPTPDLDEINGGDLAEFMLSELHENKYVKKRVGISNL